MTIAGVALAALVVLGVLVLVLGWPCWGVETYTISTRDLPNVAARLDDDAPAAAEPVALPCEEAEAA